jgi:LemA protein
MESSIFLVILGGLTFGLIAGYNRLVNLKNRFKNSFAQIDVQLKRRYDLIPNLVEVAKGYLQHERDTLEAVIAARNQAAGAERKAAADPGNSGAIQSLQAAEGLLGQALGRLFALVESYPNLKANQNMLQLSEELSSTENRIAFARQAFNDAVMDYNTTREQFPTNLLAGLFGFEPAQSFELKDEKERQAPAVSFA